jgi:hypothetical protein
MASMPREPLRHRSDYRHVGNGQSRHQAEPSSGADDPDLLDHKVQPGTLAAAGREDDDEAQED